MSSAHIRMNKAQKTFSSPRLIHASSWNTLISTSAVLNYPFSHADCKAGILWPESLYYRTERFPFANVFTKNRFKKQNWQSFFKSKLQIVYNLCACYIKPIPYIEMIVLCVFSTKSFWLPFCIKTFPALQGSNEAPWGRAFWGAVRHESAACATKPQEPTERKKRNGLGKSPCWDFPPPKKGGSLGGHFFPHPTHPTQLLFFPGFLLLVWWNLAWNLCMNMFIMPVKHEVATTNEALEGYATQNFSRFITRSSFPKN